MRLGARYGKAIALAALATFVAACASKQPTELVPPRLDLARYRALGLVEFSANGAQGLGAAATREFMTAIHAAQPGTPVLELGRAGAADPQAVKALATRSDVDVVVLGEVSEHKSTPRLALDPAWRSASAQASLEASLDVRMLDGATGATIWSASSRRSIPIASLNVSGGLPRLDANPVEEARAILVRDLVDDVTFDLRSRWVQR